MGPASGKVYQKYRKVVHFPLGSREYGSREYGSREFGMGEGYAVRGCVASGSVQEPGDGTGHAEFRMVKMVAAVPFEDGSGTAGAD